MGGTDKGFINDSLLIINDSDMLTSIPVKEATKKRLESMKGRKTWDDFLSELANAVRVEKRTRCRKKMGKLLEMGPEEVRVRRWAREY